MENQIDPKTATTARDRAKKLPWELASFGISLLIYTYLLSLPAAMVLILSIFVHECGHIWAARMLGIRFVSLYFIPFVGGIASIERMPNTCKGEAVVALMGPLWGIALGFVYYGLYLYTDLQIFAAAVYINTLINFFNLLPLHPMDGGRVANALATSLSINIGRLYRLACCIVAPIIGYQFSPDLAFALAFISLSQLRWEVSKNPQPTPMDKPGFTLTFGSYAVVAIALGFAWQILAAQPLIIAAFKMYFS